LGDIFREDNPNPNYGQPPLVYYQRIFQSQRWRKIVIITAESTPSLTNPIFLYLSQRPAEIFRDGSTNVTFRASSNLTADWHMMLCARHFVASRSTLSGMIVDLSPFLQEYFTVRDCPPPDEFSYPIRCRQVPMRGYEFKNWTNSPEQRLNMFNFGRSRRFETLPL
jgi:hypothetical protein